MPTLFFLQRRDHITKPTYQQSSNPIELKSY
jgi:hypothetical protein